MNVDELIADLAAEDIAIWLEAGELRFRAPRGAMTPQRRAVLREHREAIRSHLADGRVPQVADTDEAHRHEPFPLSDLQAAYLVGRGDLYEHGGVACHAYIELGYPAGLSPDRVSAAWEALVTRHDMLRALVHADGYQVVLTNPPHTPIDVADLRGQGPDAGRARIEAVRAELGHRVARTDRWPLCVPRITWLDDALVVHLSLDLLVVDYASAQILLAELDRLCTDAAASAALPSLAVTFRDYVLARRAVSETAGYQRDRAYWLGRLDTLPAAPELPAAPPPTGDTAAKAARFDHLEHLLTAAEWARLRETARSHGLTVSAVLLTAYAEVIGRWSRTPRFTLNLPVFQRLPVHPDIEAVVGEFTAVELLAVDLTEPAGFADRATAVSAQLIEDLSHPLFTGSEVLAELAHRTGQRPLMPVVFTSTLDTAPQAEAASTVRYAISQTPQVWVDCQVMPRAGGLSLSWDVRRGVLPDGLAGAAFGSYVEAVRRLAADPAAWTDPAPVTLPDTQLAVRRAVNDTAGPVPGGLLHEEVLAQAARTPDAVAVASAPRDLTYRELATEARAVATRLTAAGVGPAEPVAIGMDKGWEQVVGVLGVQLAGAAYLPVDTSQPAARRAAILADAGVRLLLTQPGLAESAGWPAGIEVLDVTAPTGTDLPGATEPGLAGQAGGKPPADPDDPAYVIYTSGSTGTPKGVMISHRAALNTVVDINSRFKVGPGDAVLGLASLGFDLSVYDVFGPLSVGARLVLPDADRRSDPSHWAGLVRDTGVTIWNSVPGQLQMLAEFLRSVPEAGAEAELPTLRLAMLSGDWIPVPLPDEIRRLVPGLQVVSLGGATEGAIWSIAHPVGVVDRDRPSIPYGTPLTNQTFHVLDGAMRDRPDWVPGELYIGGTGVALGYLGDSRRTAERFVDHPVTGGRLYRTGDLGRYHPDGTIEFLGREDDQVKIRGYRIELAEVETAILANPRVGAAAVVVDDSPSGRRLAAFVEPAHLTDDDTRAAYFPATDAQAAGHDAAEATHHDAEPVDPRALNRFLTAMDDVALGLMARTLADAGLPTGPAPLDPEAVCAALRATPTSAHVVRRWLRALATTGRLDAATGRLAADAVPDDEQLATLWSRLDDAEAAVSYGTDLVAVMRTCAAHLPALVNGELDIRALLFPGADTDVLAAAYRDNLALRHLHRGAAAAARRIAALHAAGPRADEPLRVLEIGGGVAATTAELVPALAEFGADYLYTDPSRFFVREAEPRFPEFPWVRFAVFDPAADPRPQGLTPNSFDVVVCPNVLHNATDIPSTLAALTELLAPGGWLLVMENARDDHHPLLVSLEFLEATSGPRTDLRAAAGQSFLTDPQWAAVLADTGADVAAALPHTGHPLHRTGQRLFLARAKTDRAPVSPATLGRHTADRLPEYMVPAIWQVVDALPRTGNGKTDRARLAGWLPRADGPAARATRSAEPADALESQLAGLWAELLGVARIGRHDDFFALGGDSLLVARMVGQVRERIPDVVTLEWEVVLRHLLRQPTVAALAEFLRAATALGPAGRDSEAGPGSGSGSGEPDPGATGSALVELHGAGLTDPGAPVTVLVHAGTGTLMPYRALVTEIRRRSAGTAALIGLEVPALAAYLDAEPTGQVEALAAGYVRGLLDLARDAAGHREIHLVGYCLGGLIALEVARGLAEAGAPPASLTAISSHSPRFRLDDALLAEYSFAVMMGINPPDIGFPADETEVARASEAVLADTPGVLRAGGMAELDGPFTDVAARFRELAGLPRAERVERMCRAVPASAGMYTPDHMTRLLRTFQQSVFSISRYLPEPYAGDVTFLRHSGTYPFPGSKEAVTGQWEEVCLGDLRIIDVPGDHFTCLSVEHSPGVLRLIGELTSGAVTR